MRRQHTSPRAAHRLPVVENGELKVHGRKTLQQLQLQLQQRLPTLLVKYAWQITSIIFVVVVLSIAVAAPLISTTTRTATAPFHPRYVRYICSDNTSNNVKVSRLDMDMELYPSKRQIYISKTAQARQTFIQDNSDDFKYGRRDEWESEDCKAQYEWQTQSFPTCNTLHETNLLHSIRADPTQRIVGNGYWRDVWLLVRGDAEPLVFKTLRYRHAFEDRNGDRHRRDAVAMEHLTKYKMVVNIYGFCGNSGLFEYADSGSLSDIIWSSKGRGGKAAATDLERLHVAAQAAMGVAAIHNADREGVPSMVHTDITPSQFVGVNGLFKVNDFNRARFVRWNSTSKQPCPHHVGRNPGKNRSPEEYAHEPQTEKVDVYSLGNILYMLLTGLWPFEDVSEEEAQKQVKEGLRPVFPIEIWNSTNPIIQDLKEIMFRCHAQDPSKRATARQVERMLLQSLQRHDATALQRWGLEQEYGGGRAVGL